MANINTLVSNGRFNRDLAELAVRYQEELQEQIVKTRLFGNGNNYVSFSSSKPSYLIVVSQPNGQTAVPPVGNPNLALAITSRDKRKSEQIFNVVQEILGIPLEAGLPPAAYFLVNSMEQLFLKYEDNPEEVIKAFELANKKARFRYPRYGAEECRN